MKQDEILSLATARGRKRSFADLIRRFQKRKNRKKAAAELLAEMDEHLRMMDGKITPEGAAALSKEER